MSTGKKLFHSVVLFLITFALILIVTVGAGKDPTAHTLSNIFSIVIGGFLGHVLHEIWRG